MLAASRHRAQQQETTIIGTKHFGGFESGFGVGAKVMDDVPKLGPMLEAVQKPGCP